MCTNNNICYWNKENSFEIYTYQELCPLPQPLKVSHAANQYYNTCHFMANCLYLHVNYITKFTGPGSAVGNVSGNRCESDCRSRGRVFDPGPVPYFRGDWSWNNFYGHYPPFRWIIQEGLLSSTSESMCKKYWLTACSSLPRKKYG